MSHEMLLMVDAISREKDVDAEDVFTAIEESMAFAARKKLGENAIIEVKIDRKSGEPHVERVWNVREDNILDEPDQEVARIDLEPEQASLTQVREPMEVEFGRTSAQFAKQAILQRIRDIEQRRALEEVRETGDGILYGTVRGFQKGNLLLDVGRLDAQLPKTECLPRDDFKIGARVRCSILKVERVGSRDVVTVSRASPEFLHDLLEREVPEVEEGVVEIVKIARAPGIRAKVVVKLGAAARDYDDGGDDYGRGGARRPRLDPARIIIGSRGIHAKAISDELGGEHLDILIERDEPAQMLVEALSPAEVVKISIDEESRVMEAALKEESLGLAIGSRGANVRLISEALGWTVQLMSEAQWEEKEQERARKAIEGFVKDLDVDAEVAEILVQNGFSTLDEVAYVPVAELEAIEEFDEDIVAELRARARALAGERSAKFDSVIGSASESLSRVEGITGREIEELAKAGVVSSDDLADLATDELLEMVDWPQRRASELIMKARRLWDEQAEPAAAG